MRKLLTSDEDSDEEKSEKDQNESEDEKSKKDEDVPRLTEPATSSKSAKEVKEKKKEDKKSRMQKFYDAMNNGPGTGHASDFSSDSDDSEPEKVAPTKKKKKDKEPKDNASAHNSRSGTPSLVDGPGGSSTSSAAVNKRKSDIANISDNSNSPQSTPAKKMKYESAPMASSNFASYMNSKDSNGITEEAVRRYLMRKPMTTTELLKKIQSKKTGVSRDELVDMMTQILKKINPTKQTIQGKMYLSIKTPK